MKTRTLFQQPGCLPKGFTLDSMLTAEQFCVWQQVGFDWWKKHNHRLGGVVRQSRKMVRIHPRSYLETKGKRR